MSRQLRSACLVAWLALGHVAGAGAQGVVSPGPANPAEGPRPGEGPAVVAPSEPIPPHEALQPSDTHRDPEPIGKAPPPMIAERPGAQRPDPDARWIEGYWDWDRNRDDFAWVTGTWLVPPPGEFWVNGYWRRDAKGWHRVPGFWSGGGQVQVQRVARLQEVALGGRTAGPSMTRPEEPMGNPPGPDYFYVPGEYIPAWGGVAWRPGYWSPSQAGWEWIPARWERRANTWAFHEGFWNRARGPMDPPAGGQPPAVGTTLASATAGIGPPPPRMVANPALPAGAATTRGEVDQKAAETNRSGPGAGNTAQNPNGASPKPGEPKPVAQPVYPQPPPYGWYGPRPANPPGRAPRGNPRSAIGGFLRRVLP